MNLTKGDSSYFIEYVLLDEASRLSSGRRKRQTQPMAGFWLARYRSPPRKPGKAKSRLSDRRERRFVCICELSTVEGCGIEMGANEVAQRLRDLRGIGNATSKGVAVIREGYYHFKASRSPLELASIHDFWVGSFLHWRGWALCSDDWTINAALARYELQYGEPRRRQLEVLIRRLRADPAPVARNREWLEAKASIIKARLDSKPKDAGSDWDLIGSEVSYLLGLAHLYVRLGRPGEAGPLYWRAWGIWLSAPTVSPQLRKVLLSWVAIAIGCCVGGKPPGTITACHGPYGVRALLAPPAA
jgi:hypothetical protein